MLYFHFLTRWSYEKSKSSDTQESLTESPPAYSFIDPDQNDAILLSKVAQFLVTKQHSIVYDTSVRIEYRKTRFRLDIKFGNINDPAGEVLNIRILVVAAR